MTLSLTSLNARRNLLATQLRVPVENLDETVQANKRVLDARQYDALASYYKIGLDHAFTLKEIAQILKVSQERVRQLIVKANICLCETVGRENNTNLPESILDYPIEDFFTVKRANQCGVPHRMLTRILNGLSDHEELIDGHPDETHIRVRHIVNWPRSLTRVPNLHKKSVEMIRKMLATEGLTLSCNW